MPTIQVKDANGSIIYLSVASGSGTSGDPYVLTADRATETTLALVKTADQAMQATLGATTDATDTTDADGTMVSILRGIRKLFLDRWPSLGQKAKSGSVSVTLASGHDDVPVAASENHIGEISEPIALGTLSPTVDTSAYTDGNVLFETTALDIARVNGGTGKINALTVLNKDNQAFAFDLVVMRSNVALGAGINTVLGISDANSENVVGVFEIGAADYRPFGSDKKMATIPLAEIPFKAADGETNVYVAGIARDTQTPTDGIFLTFLGTRG